MKKYFVYVCTYLHIYMCVATCTIKFIFPVVFIHTYMATTSMNASQTVQTLPNSYIEISLHKLMEDKIADLYLNHRLSYIYLCKKLKIGCMYKTPFCKFSCICFQNNNSWQVIYGREDVHFTRERWVRELANT